MEKFDWNKIVKAVLSGVGSTATMASLAPPANASDWWKLLAAFCGGVMLYLIDPNYAAKMNEVKKNHSSK